MYFRTPKEVQQHLHFYNGIQKLIPSLRNELDTISPDRLTKIIQAVRICAYMQLVYYLR
jgi:hypothetical protein